MNHIDEYRNPAVARGLLTRIYGTAKELDRKITVMEVCGSHTTAIGRFGISRLLPDTVRLISGPGCPVCVTSVEDCDRALYLAGMKDTTFVTFGDMLRVPGTEGKSLQTLRAEGADIRVAASAAEVIAPAGKNPDRPFIFMGIGFETTAPTVAAVIQACRKEHLENVSLLSVHKTIPPAMKALMGDSLLDIDGFICPGHVSTIIGARAYQFIADAGRAAVITGFEPVDILEGILMIADQLARGTAEVEIQYSRGVSEGGNPRARHVMEEVFSLGPAIWRGLGEIPESGLFLRSPYRNFDALNRFEVPPIDSKEPKGCRCGDVLRGLIAPEQCPLFDEICNPSHPVGPCMVSSEGTCSSSYKYRGGK